MNGVTAPDARRLRGDNPGWYRFRIGMLDACVLTDGPIPLPVGGPVPLPELPAIFYDLDRGTLERLQEDLFLPKQPVAIEQNLLLVDLDGDLVLFDTGSGDSGVFGGRTGRLLQSLAEISVAPQDVSAVVLSHAHTDHCWGTVKSDGTATFPNARAFISCAEYDFWLTRNPADDETGVMGFRKYVWPLRDRLTFITDGNEVLPGVQAVLTPGHTPGHMAFTVSSGDSRLCVTGDVFLHHVVSLAHPGAARIWILRSRATLERRS
jgi:glyoxylase-like metal-dependent hydrolase (beta-lactamase superfamily II)